MSKPTTTEELDTAQFGRILHQRPANDEMVQGYRDGFDLDNPEPSENRSASYRHGFANGRADKTGKSRGLSLEQLSRRADLAMLHDDLQ